MNTFRAANTLTGLTLTMALTGFVAMAQAQTPPSTAVGLGVGYLPKYEGAKDYRVAPVPLVAIKKQAFFLRGLEAGVELPLSRQVTAGPLVTFLAGRREDDSERLRGLGGMKNTLGYGAFINGQFDAFNTYAKYIQSTRTAYGATLTVGGGYSLALGTQDTVIVGLESSWANNRYMQAYYGVSASQAAASQYGLRTYNATSGLAKARGSVTWSHVISPAFSIVASLGATTLLGDAADSPIIEKPTSFFSTAGLLYHF